MPPPECAGGAQHQRAEECQQATLEEDDLSPSLECPEPIPKLALPPGFEGVTACPLKDSPSLAPIEAPRAKAARYVHGAHSDNSVCHPNNSGQGHQGHISGHSSCLGGESGPQEPLHGG